VENTSRDVAKEPVDATAGRDAEMTGEESMTLDPTPAEIEAWVARERARREAWLSGPTEDERAAFVRRERERRLARLGRDRDLEAREIAREMLRYPREAQLAAEGAVSLLWRWYRRWMTEMVRAGHEFEEELGRSERRSRVKLDDDET